MISKNNTYCHKFLTVLHRLTHTLAILFEYGWSMARVCLGFAYSMARVCLQYAYATPTLSLRYPYAKKGTYVRGLTNPVSLAHEPMFIGSRTYGSRKALILAVLMLAGITGAWGQATPSGTDYSGYYYIANFTGNNDKAKGYDVSTPATNYYLCSAKPDPNAGENYNYDAIYYDGDSKQQPYLTTYRTGRVEVAMWKVEFAKTIGAIDYYYIRYCADNNKYLTHNASKAVKNNRFTVHLQATAGTNNESLFCFETTDDESFNIRPQKVSSGNRHINPANGNKNYYYGNAGTDTEINGNTVNPGGMVGYWSAAGKDGYASRWYLERVQPNISYNSADHTIEISNIDEDVTIYYTDDGTTEPTTEQTENTGTNPIVITDVNNSVSIKAIAAKSGVLPSTVSEIRVVPSATITLGSSSITYNGSEQKPSVTVKDGDTPIPISEYEVGYSNNVNASDAAVVTVTNATGGNCIVYGSTTFSISKKDLSITAKPKTITYGEEPANDGVTYSGFVNEEDESVLSGTLAYSYNYSQYGDAGSYAITPSGLTGGNYNISYVDGTLTVDQKEVGLTWSETTSFPYDGTSHILTATATGMVNGDEIDVAVSGAQTNAGNHTATASELAGTKAGNYKLPTEKTHAFTITPVGLTVTANNNAITYGDAPAGNGVTYSGFVGEEDESVLGGSLGYDYSYTQYGDVGNTYTITPKGLTSDNYDIAFVAGTLTVNPKALTIIAEAKSKAYGDADPALTYTSEGLVGSDAITGALSREAGEGLGTYAIYQNTVTASSNYTITYTGANMTITPKTLTVTAKPKTITYGDTPTNDGVTYSGFVGEEDESVLEGTLAYAYDYAQYNDAGDYNITPSGLTGANYDISFVAGTLTVNPKEVEITWGETTTFVYDATSHAPTATITGLLNGDAVGVNVTGQQTNVGDDYTATASGLTGAKAGSYTLTGTDTKTFSITPAALTITAKNHTISYGDMPANNGVDYDGFAGDDNTEVLEGTLSYAYNYEQYGDVGDDYTITPSGLTSTNYSISYHSGTLTVKEKTIVLKWTNTSFIYDREGHQPSATAVGTVNGEEIAVTVTAPTAINAGEYTATASGLTGDQAAHYELPAVNTHIFTIAPKILGNGDLPAEDITIKLTSAGELEYVKDGENTLTADDDYTCDIHNEGSDQIVAVTGTGNYTGSIRGIYAQPQFYDVDEEGPGKAVAVYMSSRDVETFDGVDAYTVKSVNTFLGLLTVSKLEYIPKGVPVLLLSASDETGFVVEEKDESKADISEETVNSNLLKMAPTGGVPVDAAQVYMFYLGEFVLTKAGTITSGKFYILNPNYKVNPADPSAAPVRRSLMIVEEETTDIANMPDTGSKLTGDVWYTLDGRRLSSKPVNKGLYIHNGRKTIIK